MSVRLYAFFQLLCRYKSIVYPQVSFVTSISQYDCSLEGLRWDKTMQKTFPDNAFKSQNRQAFDSSENIVCKIVRKRCRASKIGGGGRDAIVNDANYQWLWQQVRTKQLIVRDSGIHFLVFLHFYNLYERQRVLKKLLRKIPSAPPNTNIKSQCSNQTSDSGPF